MLSHHGYAFVAGLFLSASVAIAEESTKPHPSAPAQPSPPTSSVEPSRASRRPATTQGQTPGAPAENQTQVTITFRMLECSRTKFAQLGLDAADFPALLRKDSVDRNTFFVAEDPNEIDANVESLTQTVARIVTEPTISMLSGSQATFDTGSEVREVPATPLLGNGAPATERRKFGTSVDVAPVLQKDGSVKLEFRLRVTEVDPTLTRTIEGREYPGIRVRQVATGAVLRPRQTHVMRGLVQSRVESRKVGPKIEEVNNEIELLVLVRVDY